MRAAPQIAGRLAPCCFYWDRSFSRNPRPFPAAQRAQIRAVVVTPPSSIANPVSGTMSTTVIPVNIACTVMASLEIMDDSTGVTSIFTTDLRPMPAFRLVAQPAAR
jgi:hypothetical protein